MKQEQLLDDKCKAFAQQILEFVEQLKHLGIPHLVGELLREGVGIGIHVRQALSMKSRRNYLLKMNLASSNAIATAYWLELIARNQRFEPRPDNYLREVKEIISILSIILKLKQL